MSTINIGNKYGSKTINATNNNNNSELNSLIKEKESLQKDIQSLQKEAASSSGSESENLQTQVQSLQSQISNIDNQIAKIQAEKKEDISSENLLNDYNKIKYPDHAVLFQTNPDIFLLSFFELLEVFPLVFQHLGLL